MKFEELIKLDIANQIEYLNNKLGAGLSVKEIRGELNVGEKKLQKYLKSINFKFDQKTKSYIKVTKVVNDYDSKENYKDNHLVVKHNEKPRGSKNNTLSVGLNDYDKLMNMISTYEDISEKMNKLDEMIEWYEIQKSVIDVTPPKLEIPPTNQEIVSRSFKIYRDVMEDFSKFCKKNNNYKVQDIISFALRKFMDEYK